MGAAGAIQGTGTLASEATPQWHEHSAIPQTRRAPAPAEHQPWGPPPHSASQTPTVPFYASDIAQFSAAFVSPKACLQAAAFMKERPSITRDGVSCVGGHPSVRVLIPVARAAVTGQHRPTA